MQSNSLSIRLYLTLKNNTPLFVHLPLGIYWVSLFILTSIPADAIPIFFSIHDKSAHFLAYLLLSLFLNLSLHFQNKYKVLYKRSNFTTAIFIVSYAFVDEVHQIFIPGRFYDFYDWLADVLGGFFGILIVYLFIKNYKANLDQL